MLGCGDTIHDRHVYICQDNSVPNIAASLLHIGTVHINGKLAVVCLVAFFAEEVFENGLEWQQVEYHVIN